VSPGCFRTSALDRGGGGVILGAGAGAQVNGSKQKILELKALVEHRRVQRAMAPLSGGSSGPPDAEDPEETRAKELIEKVGGGERRS
jgi:hypothetical protein